MLALAMFLGLIQGPLDGRREALDPLLEQVIGRAVLQAIHRRLFPQRAGDDDDGNARLLGTRLCQGRVPVVVRQAVVAQDEVERGLVER